MFNFIHFNLFLSSLKFVLYLSAYVNYEYLISQVIP